MNDEERALARQKLTRSLPTDRGCLEWQGARSNGRYGSVWIGSKAWTVHRLAWILENGPIPDGMVVLHKCDNPPCINLDHLRLGTQLDNIEDRVQKGRNGSARGARHGHSRLTAEQVADIRARAASGVPQADLAREFGYSKPGMGHIIRGNSWRVG